MPPLPQYATPKDSMRTTITGETEDVSITTITPQYSDDLSGVATEIASIGDDILDTLDG